MTKATSHHTPLAAPANSACPIPLDLQAINNAAADIHEIKYCLVRLTVFQMSDFEFVVPSDLTRCRAMLAEVERIVAREAAQ